MAFSITRANTDMVGSHASLPLKFVHHKDILPLKLGNIFSHVTRIKRYINTIN